MNILLIQLDGRLPNLALMRMAHHFRAKGDRVELRRCGNKAALEPRFEDYTEDGNCMIWDRVYASAIFQSSRPLGERVLEIYKPNILGTVDVGGTGYNLYKRLSSIGVDENGPLDYSDYPKWKQSMGFTQRGCRLACDFCVVPKKEGKVVPVALIEQIWRGDPWPREILLLDNDFFGNPYWKERIAELKGGKFKVCFNQGINARMLNDETAEAIASVDYRDDQMTRKRIYTAWDGKKDERTLFRGLEALVRAGVKPDWIMVYMLIGHESGETFADRDYRRRKLREFGARPYPMPFTRTPELVGFQRWVVGAYDKRVPWSEWSAARFSPRQLRDRVTLPLFKECTCEQDPETCPVHKP